MRTKLFTIAVSGLFCLGFWTHAASVRAEDDVYVDLSVLDSLGRAPAAAVSMPVAPSVSSGPLFPVVKKAEPRKKTVVKAPKSKKSKVKAKAKKAEVKVEVKQPQSEDKIILPPKPTVDPIAENKPDVATENLSDSPFSVEKSQSVTEVTSAAPVASVTVEEQPVIENQNPPIAEPMNAIRELPAADKQDEVIATSLPESVFDNAEETVTKPVAEEEKAPMPLIPAEVEESTEVQTEAIAPVSADKVIVFEEEKDILDEASQRKLDEIVAGFENPSANKIAINAYNFDDGVDVFRKKRLNLYRAIAVRSYLLNKGYKNFSLKVITITDDAEKKNCVTVEELK